MQTRHVITCQDARDMSALPDKSIDLVVTSPPYPMIEMWDRQFADLDPTIASKLTIDYCREAFDAMHSNLNLVWSQLFRVMKEGAYACINIGDATRTIGGRFQLFPNRARIESRFFELGFDVLPPIIWRKQTNAPNKFMGSGMLPAGAYVTLEHESILIFRKGGIRTFTTEDQKIRRRQSAYFWEERNSWFSDLWDFKGVRQEMNNKERKRSAAYPFEVPFRLVNMYSLLGDTVFDPFTGTGTTNLAAIASGRNSIGFDHDSSVFASIRDNIIKALPDINDHNLKRLKKHLKFISDYQSEKGSLKYINRFFGFPVMTAQEKELKLPFVEQIEPEKTDKFIASYYNDEIIKQISVEALTAENFCFSNGMQLQL